MCNKIKLIIDYNDRHAHVWVNNLIRGWKRYQHPCGLAAFIRTKYNIDAELMADTRIKCIFESETDATAFILKLS